MPPQNILIYLLRRDLRLEDNPIFHAINLSSAPYTHLLPVYIFAAQQIEVSGFIPKNSSAKSPYPEARSQVGQFMRCGPHRATFLAESVWDLRKQLKSVGSGLEIRVGMVGEVIKGLIDRIQGEEARVGGVWMTSEEGVEEKREETDVKKICGQTDVEFKLYNDEKYFVDDHDGPFGSPEDIPDVFTTYRKAVEPLRAAPRDVLPAPKSLPPLPTEHVPPQHAPFTIPSSYDDLESSLLAPISLHTLLPNPLVFPPQAQSAHPFHGGATTGLARITDLITNGSMTQYKATRNGLIGTEFSTKLSAWLALGCITARQIHAQLLGFEDGEDLAFKEAEGFGKGENDGTKAVRFELLWRDYMRLCTRKFGPALFRVSGFRNSSYAWKSPASDSGLKETLQRFLEGTTGMGLIDASQRELFLTGYTSNRARQNVASFLAKHLGLDWRIGAEWYESLLVDYDVSSNWGNWQYVAGVGNDPRGEARVFNPVKQAWDYDPKGEYIATWVPELKLEQLTTSEVFQAWTIAEKRKEELGFKDLVWVEQPLKKIEFTVGKWGGKQGGKQGGSGKGGYRGKSARSDGQGGRPVRGFGGGRAKNQHSCRYSCAGGTHRGGREARTGMVDKDMAAKQNDQEA
ncbi:MAG: hypothetical protein M1818_002033 [Claussenomyces sp. TS43310]|nr:MAG: hypothetical protein M1818_002033 [Claussenomyces sp. TS43310]